MDPRASGVPNGSFFRVWGVIMKIIESVGFCIVYIHDDAKAFLIKDDAVKYIESIGLHTWDFEYYWRP